MELSAEKIKKLKEDFPPEALSTDSSRGFELTSIKAMYVIDRLNDVFGPLGWGYGFTDPIEKEGEQIVKVTLIIPDTGGEKPHTITHYGGKKVIRNNVTDAYKSAITDGLTKCASILGIGHKVFKGQVHVPKDKPSQPTSAPASPINDEPIRDEIKQMMGEMYTDPILFGDELEKISGFQGDKGWVKGKKNLDDLKGKWLFIVYQKVKEQYEEFIGMETTELPGGE